MLVLHGIAANTIINLYRKLIKYILWYDMIATNEANTDLSEK